MRDDIARVMRLVKEGKLSPEDAADLIDAMQGSPEGVAATREEAKESKSGFDALIDSIEKIGKEVAGGINWTEVSKQVRTGVTTGAESLKKAAQEIREGRLDFILREAERRQVELPLSVPPGKLLWVENVTGDLTIETGNGMPGLLKADATFRGGDREQLKSRADAYTVVIEESEQHVIVRQLDQVGLRVDFVLVLPESVPVEIRSDSGDVTVRGCRGGCRITSTSGDIKLSKVEGALDLDVASGAVHLADCDLTLGTLANKSGDFFMNHVRGNLSIRSASGDIHLDDWSGRNLSVESVSGDVRVQSANPIEGAVSVRTVSGDVLVQAPDGSNARVVLSSLSGDVHSSLPLQDEVRGERKITGRLGAGEGSLDLSAVSGDIHLAMRAQE